MHAAVHTPPPSLPVGHLVDDYAMKRIGYRAERLGKRFFLTPEDKEDLKQEFIVELLKAEPRFDPERNRRTTFISGVLDLHYKRVVRQRTRRARLATFCPLNQGETTPDGAFRTEDPHGTEDLRRTDLRMDVKAVMASLPVRARQVCQLLMTHSAAETARKMGLSRPTIMRETRAIRPYFEKAGLALLS